MTGLDYAINRHYDSLQGRFTQVDPIGMRAANLFDPQSLNMYAYCGNDPINRIDPDGLFWGKLFKWIAKALKWIAIAVTAAVIVLSAIVVPGSTGFLASTLKFVVGFLAKIGSVLKFASGGLLAAEGGAIALAQLGLKGLWVLASIGAVADHFQQVELSGEKRRQWDTARFVLLSVLTNPNSRCYKFLKSRGFDPGAIAKDLETQKPYDGFLSTNPEDFGAAGASPKEFFEAYRKEGYPLDAATANSGNIYYGNARRGITSGLVLHENLHRQAPALSEDALGKRLGTWKTQKNRNGTYKDSSAINRTLERNGCK